MAPAFDCARRRSIVTQYEAGYCGKPSWRADPESRGVFSGNGQLFEQDEILKQPELAQYPAAIARNPDEFLSRPNGRTDCRLPSSAAEALITTADLAAYK